jgi:hypothetical protein
LTRPDGTDAAGISLPVELVRDVTGTLEEFDASLRQVPVGRLDGEAPSYAITDGDVQLRIHVVRGPDRRIALLRLPTLTVTFRFDAGSAAARSSLLARLDRGMHRGGG